MRRAAIAFVAALLGASCTVLFPEPTKITMQAQITADVHLTDTFSLVRSISNGERDTLWLEAAMPGFNAIDGGGARGCYLDGLTTLEQVLKAVPPGQTTRDVKRFPIAALANCGPGIYTVTIYATLYHSMNDPRLRRVFNWGAPSLLVRLPRPTEIASSR